MTTELLPKTEATDTTATLYDRHHRRIRGYCLGQLRDSQEADDAVQSTFLYAFSALQRGTAPRNELPWLFTIAHNVCRTRKRSLRRRSRLEAGVDLDSLRDTIGRDDPSRDELEELGTSLLALPENQRRALLLREWQGLSYAEVAARMGLTESAVEAVLFRARRNLAQKLRATDRLASAGALISTNLRRLGSLFGFGKTAAATVAIGLAAGTAVRPFIHAQEPKPSTVRQSIAFDPPPARGRPALTGTTPRAVRTPPRTNAPRLAREAAVEKAMTPATFAEPEARPAPEAGPDSHTTGRDSATTSPAPPPAEAPGAVEPEATTTTEQHAQSRQGTTDPVSTTAAQSPPEPPKAPDPPNVSDVASTLPSQVQRAVPNLPAPIPPLPSNVKTPTVPKAVPVPSDQPTVTTPTTTTPTTPDAATAPTVPTPSPDALPSVTPPSSPPLPPSPLPEGSTQSSPLQVP